MVVSMVKLYIIHSFSNACFFIGETSNPLHGTLFISARLVVLNLFDTTDHLENF